MYIYIQPSLSVKTITHVVLMGLMMGGIFISTNTHASELGDESKWSYQVGVDTWRLQSSADKDTDPGYISESSNLLLPNAYTKWNYSDTFPYGWVMGQKPLTRDTSVSLRARVDQTLGLRIDEAQVQTNFSPSLGARYGIVDYKTSWCRTTEPDNGWMREIETICSTTQFRDVTGGSPGAQLYTSTQWGRYLIQSQIGAYRPLLLDYAPKEYGNLIPSNDYRVLSNKKIGLNVNLINLDTPLEMRISYIKGHQTAYSPEPYLLGHNQQSSDMVYLGFNLPITRRLSGRITHLQQMQEASCRSTVAKFATACNLNLTFDKYASTLEFSYRLDSTNLFSVGISKTVFEINQDLFTQKYDLYSADLTALTIKQRAIAWRHDWGEGLFSVIQFIQSQQLNGQRDNYVGSTGSALGARLGYQF
ncbi:hypothetical protein [Limnohabitans sp.]|uniref:hypothetical protein n=1 Tax=Limnohabitans sp. TaxID=1907725 RepID=UPI00286F646E|nr:hypothetical protein [Limnohabitans sp.]